jgi:AsmA protein
MEKRSRSILMVVGGISALIILVILCVPLFLNADSFRNKIEATLSSSLGRKVTLGKLDLSVWSGSLVAQNATVADDPRFSTQPFLQAAVVKINVEVLPLIFGQQVHITGFALDTPRISLLRAADGTWNYSSIGSAAKSQSANKEANSMMPNLTVGHIEVSNGELTIGTTGATGAAKRTYDKLNLDVKDFSFTKTFPFTVSVHLPGDGTVSMKGTAGPVNEKDASLTPFAANVEMKHIDPLAAGFVDAGSGITGLIGGITVDATWNGQQLRVTKLLVDSPTLAIVRNNLPAAPTAAAPSSNDMLSTLSADLIQVKNGTLTITTKGQQGAPAIYQQMNAEVKNFSPKTASPFTLSAVLPGGGSLAANGSAGPLNQQDAAASPLDVHATLRHVDLASSGVAPDAGIAGIATIDVRAISNGQTLNANAAAHVDGLRVAKNGTPSAKPVDVKATVTQNMRALTGDVQQATVTIGRAVINISGTYQTSGPTTALNLKVVGQGVPIDELEAFLPSVGVKLPSGSRLQGGTLTTTLNVTGSSANPIISGPLRLDNTMLAGFDLGAKMQSVTALMGGGGGRTGSGTQIQSLSTNIRVAGGAVRTDNLSIVVPAFGTATGAGSVSAAGGLDYQMILKVTALGGGGGSGGATASAGGIAGQLMGMIPGGASGGAIGGVAGAALKNGIPVAIGGTTSNPTFTPNMNALAKAGAGSAAQGLLNGQTGAGKKGSQTDQLTNALGGLLGKH